MPYYNEQDLGGDISVYEEGVLVGVADILDFRGAGVTATFAGSTATVTVPGGPGTPVHNEVPAGAINGVNTIFTLANSPTAGTVEVYLNGARQKPNDDYTIVGATITFSAAPLAGSNLLADYAY